METSYSNFHPITEININLKDQHILTAWVVLVPAKALLCDGSGRSHNHHQPGDWLVMLVLVMAGRQDMTCEWLFGFPHLPLRSPLRERGKHVEAKEMGQQGSLVVAFQTVSHRMSETAVNRDNLSGIWFWLKTFVVTDNFVLRQGHVAK